LICLITFLLGRNGTNFSIQTPCQRISPPSGKPIHLCTFSSCRSSEGLYPSPFPALRLLFASSPREDFPKFPVQGHSSVPLRLAGLTLFFLFPPAWTCPPSFRHLTRTSYFILLLLLFSQASLRVYEVIYKFRTLIGAF